MIFLSNRKLRLIIITLLLLIFCFFIGLFKPKALTYNAVGLSMSGQSSWSSGMLIVEYPQNGMFKNYEGTFIVSFVSRVNVPPYNFQLNSNTPIKCDIGNGTAYSDNTTQATSYTAICKGKLGGAGLTSVSIDYINATTGQGVNNVNLGATLYYISNDSAITNEEMIAIMTSFSSQLRDDLNQLHRDIIGNQNSVTNIQNNTQNINDSINDDSIDSSTASSSASAWNGKNASNGTITQLLTLPITLLQAIVNGISTSCSSFSLGSLFGTNITLPCINLSNLIGSGLFTTIDILFSGFMILAIGKKLIKIFNDFTNLKSNQIDELYGGGK